MDDRSSSTSSRIKQDKHPGYIVIRLLTSGVFVFKINNARYMDNQNCFTPIIRYYKLL